MDREAENNLPLGILQRMKDSKPAPEEAFLLKVEEEGGPVYMTMRTPPHLWILPSVPGVTSKHLEKLARYLFENGWEVPGVLGEGGAVKTFVKEWVKITGAAPIIHMRQAIYRLNELKIQPSSTGELITADHSHLELLQRWLKWFGQETNEPLIEQAAQETAEEMIRSQRAYLWIVEGEVVSMAARARVTPHGATVNAVYTPDEFKRRGYATQTVAALTQKLLNQGYQFCALYTDLDNPTSNSIYKKIGYEWIGNSIVYHFIDE